MNAAHWHLMIVHVPVVGIACAVVLIVLSIILKSTLLVRVGYGFGIASAVGAVIAYYTGAPAYDIMREHVEVVDEHYVEQHALVGRISFVAMVLFGVVSLQALLKYAQGTEPRKFLRWAILVVAVICSYTLAWTAHLGGLVRHTEIREPGVFFFPELPRSR